MDTKICNYCGSSLPLTYFSYRNDTQTYRNECKSCVSKKRKAKYVYKPLVLKYHSDEERKVAARERAKEWYKNNKDKAKARIKDFYSTPHGKDLRTKSLAKRKIENPDYWRRKKKIDKTIRRSRELNAGYITLSSIVALELYNVETFSFSGFTCEYCGKNLSRDYHLEHLTPLCKGGTSELQNLCISCAECNLKKGPKALAEFRPDLQEYFSKRNL